MGSSVVVFGKEELDDWERDLISQSYRAVNLKLHSPKFGDFMVGPQCRWCRAKGICAKYANEREMEIGVPMTKRNQGLPAPSTLTSEQIAKVLEHRKELEDFFKSVETYALAKARAGVPIRGTKLIRGRANRRWAGEHVARELQALGVDPYQEPKLRPFTQVEKELGKGRIDHLLIKPQGKLQVVPDGDPRPEAQDLLDFEPYDK